VEDKVMTMERRLRGLLWIGATLAFVGCGKAEAGDGTSDGQVAEGALLEGSARLINVEVSSVGTREFVEVIRLTGTAWANQDVTISAEEAGVVRSVIRDKGSEVKAGDWLLKIDDRILTSQVAEARAQSEFAMQTWERRKRLYEEDQVGSELAYLEAKYLAQQTAARLATLEERLSRTMVRAPIQGVLETRFVEVGTMVGVGTEVARVVNLDPVKIIAGVPERYAADVEVGAEARVYFDVLEEPYTGTVSYVGATVDPRDRTFGIELLMENPQAVIKPEMVANVELVRRVVSNAIVVPQEALIRVESGYVVFVVDESETVESRPVEVGASQRNEVVIESGLASGDRLIVVGQKLVAAGDRVSIVGQR
jgi:membrane fusion protein, multidrug efflux system